MRRVLGIVMAGGKGERLQPLTKTRSKAAVPFGGRHRIIDFVLSNFVNSKIYGIYVLVQYKAQSLIEHVGATWRIGGRLPETFVTVVPPQMRSGETWYRGTADAVYQNLNLIQDFAPDHVAVFGADHIYRMDLAQMLDFHVANKSDATVAALPVPVAEAHAFGVIATASDGRIEGFQEKPTSPQPMPGDPTRAFGSMGNYVFKADVLWDAISADARQPTEHDFGRTILPSLLRSHRVFAYDFLENRIPGLQPHEVPGYWRDVGTIRAYYDAHMDLLGDRPAFDLDNRRWAMFGTSSDSPPVRIRSGEIEDCLLAEGCMVDGARVVRSILGRGVRIGRGAVVENSILMDYCDVAPGARIRGAIIDRFNRVPAGAAIERGAPGTAPHELPVHFDAGSGIPVVARAEPYGPLP